MILRMMGTLGEPPVIILKNGQKSSRYFNSKNRPILRPNSNDDVIKPNSRPLDVLLEGADPDFYDLVRSCLNWRPLLRISPEDALRHPFVSGNAEVPIAPRRTMMRRKVRKANVFSRV